MTISKTKNFGRGIAAILLALLLSSPAISQSPSPGTPQLTEVQAQALIQANQRGVQLTPEESRVLMQYLLQKNQPSSTAVGLAQSSSAPVQTMPSTTPQASAAAPGSEKKPGVVRIGVVLPKVQIGQGAQGPSAGEPLRAELMQYLSGPSLEVISITAMLPQQVDAEAASKQCDYLLYNSLSQKKSGGSMGFLKGASAIASMIPMAGGAGAAIGAIAATTAATQAASMSSGVTAKSQVLLEYHVSAIGSTTPTLSNSLTAKATTDGEDVITPLVEQEATAIVTEITKKK